MKRYNRACLFLFVFVGVIFLNQSPASTNHISNGFDPSLFIVDNGAKDWENTFEGSSFNYEIQCSVDIIETSINLSYPGGEGCNPTFIELHANIDNCEGTIIWSSKDESVVIVEPISSATTSVMALATATGSGSTTIRAECMTDPSCYDVCQVNVNSCGANDPPNSPTLLCPSNGSILPPGNMSFCWKNNGDPDGDTVYSTLLGKPQGYTYWIQVDAVDQEYYTVYLAPDSHIQWMVCAYDPDKNSDPWYTCTTYTWWVHTSSSSADVANENSTNPNNFDENLNLVESSESNQPPYPPVLLCPPDGSVIPHGNMTFVWKNDGDPDGDTVYSMLFGQPEGYSYWIQVDTAYRNFFRAYLDPGSDIQWFVCLYEYGIGGAPSYTCLPYTWWLHVAN